MASAWESARVAVKTHLLADATLTTLLGSGARVFDGEPAKVPDAPYVVIGEAVELPNNRMGGKKGRTVVMTVHVWSKTSTDVQRDAVAERVDDLLDNNLALVVTGFQLERLDVASIDYKIGSPSRSAWTPLRHGILRYELDLKESS